MTYSHTKVTEYLARTEQLKSLPFKRLYLWLTEPVARGNTGMSPPSVRPEFVADFFQMSAWEQANIIDGMARQLKQWTSEDFRKLVKEAREKDEH